MPRRLGGLTPPVRVLASAAGDGAGSDTRATGADGVASALRDNGL
jgi:TRAP-type uncharacterized transport system fused permease subunit